MTLAIALLLVLHAPAVDRGSCPRTIDAPLGEPVGPHADAGGHGGRVVAHIDELGPRRWVAEVTLELGARTIRRRFTAASCSTAQRAVEVAIATTVEALSVTAGAGGSARADDAAPTIDQAEPTEPANLVPSPVVPTPIAAASTAPTEVESVRPIAAIDRRTAVDSPRRVRPPRPSLAAALGAGVGVLVGPLPRPTASIDLSLALLVARWRFELAGGYAVRQRVDSADRADAARIQLWTVEARAAFVPRVRIVELPVHAGVVVGDLIAEGGEVDLPDTAHAFWGAAMLGAGVMVVPLRRLAVGAEVTGLGAFSLPTFTLGRGDAEPVVVHRPDRFGVRALVRIEVRLP